MKEGISFVTAADQGFHQGLDALLKTFTLSNKDLAPLRLIVMDCGLEGGTREKLSQSLAAFSREKRISLSLEFMQADLSRWHPFPAHWGSYATYAFLEAIRTIDTRFLVFADADMLHFKNVSSAISELEASGKMIAGIQDIDYATLSRDFYVNHLSPLSEKQSALPYINGGYQIFDLTRFLASDLDAFLETIDAGKAHERFKGVKKFKHDQTLLNAFIKGDCLILDDSYNYFCKENKRFIELDGRKNFHFISNPKPWEEGGEETVAREVVFQASEAALNGLPLPSIPAIREAPTLGESLKVVFFKLLGKTKKLRQIEARQITQEELRILQETISSWCQ